MLAVPDVSEYSAYEFSNPKAGNESGTYLFSDIGGAFTIDVSATSGSGHATVNTNSMVFGVGDMFIGVR